MNKWLILSIVLVLLFSAPISASAEEAQSEPEAKEPATEALETDAAPVEASPAEAPAEAPPAETEPEAKAAGETELEKEAEAEKEAPAAEQKQAVAEPEEEQTKTVEEPAESVPGGESSEEMEKSAEDAVVYDEPYDEDDSTKDKKEDGEKSAEDAVVYDEPYDEDDSNKDKKEAGEQDQEEEEESLANRIRLVIFGGASIPATGEDIGGGLGGSLGYDFWDQLGVELWLAQIWSDGPIKDLTLAKAEQDQKSSLKLLKARVGLRYRFYKTDLLRIYAMGHIGFEQAEWAPPEKSRRIKEGFGGDVGIGAEFRFYKFIMIDLFADYEFAYHTIPRSLELDDSVKYGSPHGLFIGLGVGFSSPL